MDNTPIETREIVVLYFVFLIYINQFSSYVPITFTATVKYLDENYVIVSKNGNASAFVFNHYFIAWILSKYTRSVPLSGNTRVNGI